MKRNMNKEIENEQRENSYSVRFFLYVNSRIKFFRCSILNKTIPNYISRS